MFGSATRINTKFLFSIDAKIKSIAKRPSSSVVREEASESRATRYHKSVSKEPPEGGGFLTIL